MGRRLQLLRVQVGLTLVEAGEPLRISRSRLSRIEMGHLPNYHEFRALLDRYGVIVSDWDDYIAAYDRAKAKGWWHQYGVANDGVVAIEAVASAITEFQFGYIPALLQTEAYLREAVLSESPKTTPEALDVQVAVLLRRQLRLSDHSPLTYHAIIDEGALLRPISDGKLRAEQLRNIRDRADLPNVKVQVIPEENGAYPGRLGGVLVASFADPDEPGIAHLEHILGSLQTVAKDKVSTARRTLDDLARRALNEECSAALIERHCTEAEQASRPARSDAARITSTSSLNPTTAPPAHGGVSAIPDAVAATTP